MLFARSTFRPHFVPFFFSGIKGRPGSVIALVWISYRHTAPFLYEFFM
jgi:hypothetical protein